MEIEGGLNGIAYSAVPKWQLPQSFHDYSVVVHQHRSIQTLVLSSREDDKQLFWPHRQWKGKPATFPSSTPSPDPQNGCRLRQISEQGIMLSRLLPNPCPPIQDDRRCQKCQRRSI